MLFNQDAINQMAIDLARWSNGTIIADSPISLLLFALVSTILLVGTVGIVLSGWHRLFGKKFLGLAFFVGFILGIYAWVGPLMMVIHAQAHLRQDCETRIGIAIVDDREYPVEAKYCRYRQDLGGEFGDWKFIKISSESQ